MEKRTKKIGQGTVCVNPDEKSCHKGELGVLNLKKLMDRLYCNIDEAKAFILSFTNFVYSYDEMLVTDFQTVLCDNCGNAIQSRDYLFPKASCQKPTGLLDTFEFGVSQELRDDLIERFDITEKDFRPIRTKRGNIVYYQITPQHVMLPIHEENGWTAKEPCPCCGSVQYMHLDVKEQHRNDKGEDIYYISQAALDDMHDLNVTCERFRFYMPEYIISRRVYDYLTERYPRTHYFPMFLK